MSYKTNSIALRLNYSVGWKSNIFPKKRFYTRDITLLLRIYLLLKGYLTLYNYKLLFYELKSTHTIKIIYLTIIKQKEIKRKKVLWKPQNNLNKLEYKNVKYMIYTRSFRSALPVLRKFSLKYLPLLKYIHSSVFFNKLIKRKVNKGSIRTLYCKKHRFARYFANINTVLLNIKKTYKIGVLIEDIVYNCLWKISYYKFNKKSIPTIIKYIIFLSRMFLDLVKKTEYTLAKNKVFTEMPLYKLSNKLLLKTKWQKHIYLQKERAKYINRTNRHFYLINQSNNFYPVLTPWTIRLSKKKNINKRQKNLLSYKNKLTKQYIFNTNLFIERIKMDIKRKTRHEYVRNKNQHKLFKLYCQSIVRNSTFHKKFDNIKKLIILKPKSNKVYKIMAKKKLRRDIIKKRLYKHLSFYSSLHLQYALANWIKYYFKLNVYIKIYNPLMTRYSGIELKKDKLHRKVFYPTYKYLTIKEKKYYNQLITFKNTEFNRKRSKLDKKYSRKKTSLHDRFLSVLNIATTYIEPQLLADQISDELQRSKSHSPILNNIRTELQHHHLGKALGLRIVINGRFNSIDRARLEYITFGRVPNNSYNARVTYALGHSYARIGVFGVKVWMFY